MAEQQVPAQTRGPAAEPVTPRRTVPVTGTAATGSAPAGTAPSAVAHVLSLQRAAGNRATTRALTGLTSGPRAPSAVVQRTRDPRLDAHLERLRELAAMPHSADALYEAVTAELHEVDLTDHDNLGPVTEVLAVTLPQEQLQRFLATVDRAAGQRPQGARPPGELAPRGPFGLHGPGILLPVAAEAARPLLEPLAHAMSSVEGLVRGLYTGVSAALGAEVADGLAERMLTSSVLNVVFAPVFLGGTAVGIATDVADTARSAYEAIVNFDEVLAEARAFLEVVASPEGSEVGRVVGEEIGRGWGAELVRISEAGIFDFAYSVGKLVGPAIVYTVCSFLGLTAVAAAGFLFARLSARLLPLLRRFPRLVAMAQDVSRRLRGTPDTSDSPDRPADTTRPTPSRSSEVSTLANADAAMPAGEAIRRYTPGSGFSGAYDPDTGRFVALASGDRTSLLNGDPVDTVPQFGGHAAAERALGAADPARSVGFVVVWEGNDTARLLWNSGTINGRNFGSAAAPDGMRDAIRDAVRAALGCRVEG